MKKRPLAMAAVLLLAWLGLPASALAQTLEKRPEQAPAPTGVPAQANSDPTYQQLRNVGLSGEASAANHLVLKRDAGTFTFRSGSFYFLAPVNGKVTGAVFLGDGSFTLTPPLDVEKRNLALLTKGPSITEEFSEVVMRFTDGTYEEIKKAAGVTSVAGDGGAAVVLAANKDTLRNKLHYNLSARILQDVMSEKPGGLFVAFLKGKIYSSKLIYAVDPQVAGDSGLNLAPEEVVLFSWDENKSGVWCSFHLSSEYDPGNPAAKHLPLLDVQNQKLQATFEKSGKLTGTAVTTFVSPVGGIRVAPFNLFRSLRVQSVTDAEGNQLSFIQEDKKDDPQFSVILPKVLPANVPYALRTTYSGTEAVSDEGGGNYYPIARTNWYPATRFDDYATYDMTFSIPKGMKMAATGARLSDVTEGNQNVSHWVSEAPQTVAGFNFGAFKSKEAKVPGMDFTVESFANTAEPAMITELQHDIERAEAEGGTVQTTLGNMSTTGMMDKATAEAQASILLYTDYFGPLPYKRVSMTQQTAPNYGQAWPELVWLPITSFFDNTIRNQLGMAAAKGYFKIVAPHEVAHQWWGHTVTWSSYRDQWMSEGFAQMSASLFIQYVWKNNKELIQFWEDERQSMIEKTRFGYRPIDVGPVTMGYRLETTKTEGVTRRLIYPKGGYILHMIRMMMWDPRTGDQRFKETMKDFVKTYTNQPASTEDFKAMIERHMTPEMDVAGNRKMDWFFNEYVYGTALPDYKFEHSFSQGGDGSPVLNMKITQSNVGPDFMMRVPVYLEFSNGRVIRLGGMPMVGNTTTEQHVPLTGMKEKPKRAILAYMNDVLCTQDGK